MEERVLEHQSTYPSAHMELSPAVEAEMSDGEWMAKEQLMKPVQLAQVNWSVTNARNTSIYNVRFPQVLSTVESIVVRTLHMYAFYKVSPCFRIQINATQFHQGQLICSFDPFSFQAFEPIYALSHFSATGLPNVKIMASESDPVELCIPFIHPRSYLTTNVNDVYNNMGTFDIRVLNPLLVAEGSTPSLTVTIWMYAKEAQVHVPIFEHMPILEATSKLPVPAGGLTRLNRNNNSKVNSSKNSQTKQKFQTNQTPRAKVDAGPILDTTPSFTDNLKTGFGQATDLIGNVVTGNFGQALRKGQGLIDTLGNIFGFDYPARTLQPDKTISPIENLAIAIGKSQSQRMAIDPFSMHVLRDDVASESLLSMDLLRISQTPMLLTQFTFLSTSPVNSLLFSVPIHPIISPLVNGNVQKTFLAFAANAFTYWNGGIVYDIEIVATRFHSGKLLFAYVPNALTVPTYISSATSLPNVVVDIQQTSSFSFKIPYTSSTAMKSTILPPVGPLLTEGVFADSCIGTLVCYVQNALANASNVAPSVEVNVYVSADTDYNLYVPRHPRNAPLNPPGVEPTSGISILEQKNAPSVTSAVLSKDQSISQARPHFGEDYALIDILRRFSYLNTFESPFAAGLARDQLDITPSQLNPFQESTYLAYFSGIYCAWSGSIRLKLATRENRLSQLSYTVVHVPDINLGNDGPMTLLTPAQTTGYAILRTTPSQDNAIELEIPYYSKYNMLLTRAESAEVAINGFVVIDARTTLPTPANIVVDYYIAVGEDFRFLYLRSPPLDGWLSTYTIQPLF